ncbi:hypothetical protein THAR02_04830 [Trichoderma harzianum]|uniref:Transcription factor domain-containing protein n=1 Tax=Trichoderma harzianum TaxID=5544 RepID=A0A0F9XDF2_TRIHA|nr:hypothetical protein THAR02_04830 [Trichoderma harzianum]
MIRFVAANSSTIGQKRQQVSRACNRCRTRKKRCQHAQKPIREFDSQKPVGERDGRLDEPITDHVSSSASSLSTAAEPYQLRLEAPLHSDTEGPTKKHNSEGTSQLERRGFRFVGDLNPERAFLAIDNPQCTIEIASYDSVGIWLADKANYKYVQNNEALAQNLVDSSLFAALTPLSRKVLSTILREECLAMLPPPEAVQDLTSIYFKKFHPIFPILNETMFRNLERTEKAHILLQQGICLVASLAPSAKRHLVLPGSETLMPHREFGRRIQSAMRISIEAGIVMDKIILIQAFSLSWMFSDGPDGRDVSSMIKGSQKEGHYERTMLCCVWAIDRLNAAFNGVPVLMQERDFGMDLTECFDLQVPSCRLFLYVISWLDKVINIYRPTAGVHSAKSGMIFTSFEDLLQQSDSLHIATPLLATIEMLYHAVVMLSCRPRQIEDAAEDPSSLRSLRELSAERITSIYYDKSVGQLTYFPFVPYAVSLSLSMACAEMRHAKVPIFRLRAYEKVRINCNILERLGEIFYFAGLMSDMGKSALDQNERLYQNTVEDGQQTYTASNNRSTALMERTDTSDHPKSMSSIARHFGGDNHVNGSLPSPLQFGSIDFMDIPYLDAFGLFDPSFGLEGIDTYL